MSNTRTIYAAAEAEPSIRLLLEDPNLSSREVARRIGYGRTTVRRWRERHLNTQPAAGQTTRTPTSGKVEVTSSGAVVDSVVTDTPIDKDWSSIFRLFNLDASAFVVVNDTVRMSTWQQSKALEDGTRDVVQLYSYSARFRRVTQDDIRPEHVDQWRAQLINDRPTAPVADQSSAPGTGTYTVLVSDPQLGKKGTAEAVENWKRGVTTHLAKAAAIRPERLHVAFMGDEHEGVVNNYTNQPHTVELNFTKQLELDFDMRVWTLRQVAQLGLPISASSVISNHGEWTRNGSKDVVTTRGDNSSTHIARQVQKFFDEMAPFTGWNIDWTIGDKDPHVIVNLSGVNAYFSHMYIEKGRGGSTEIKVKNAIERQILGKTELLQSVPLYFTAHYHHFFMQEFEGRTQFGCPALEAERSSEYMLDQYGVWSPPGLLGMLVSDDTQRGWSHLGVY